MDRSVGKNYPEICKPANFTIFLEVVDNWQKKPNFQVDWPTLAPPIQPVIRIVLLHTELEMGRLFGGSKIFYHFPHCVPFLFP